MLQMPHGMGGYGMTPNVIAQISAKVAMSSRFLGFVGSLSSAAQKLWFPNQNVQDPDTWTLPHLFQLKQEYKKLVEKFNCEIQEFILVQDPPAPPSDNLLLPPLASLHSANVRNMELPQPGEQRPVQPPSQRTISRQLMKAWPIWKTNIDSSANTRMLEQLALRIPSTIPTTKEQDLNPRPCAVNDHPSVLTHEMMVIESCDKSTRKLTWKPTGFLSHIMSRSHDDRFPIPLWET